MGWIFGQSRNTNCQVFMNNVYALRCSKNNGHNQRPLTWSVAQCSLSVLFCIFFWYKLCWSHQGGAEKLGALLCCTVYMYLRCTSHFTLLLDFPQVCTPNHPFWARVLNLVLNPLPCLDSRALTGDYLLQLIGHLCHWNSPKLSKMVDKCYYSGTPQ